MAGMADIDCRLPCPFIVPCMFASSFELVSPATLANIPSASDGFCRFENCSSSPFEESERPVWSSLLPSTLYCCCCAIGSCDQVPRLPSAWKLPSSFRGAVSGGRVVAVAVPVSSIRGFLRTRRPPLLLPPSTQSRLSRLHRRHGIEPLSSLVLRVQISTISRTTATVIRSACSLKI
jgi:hypothetical protein